MKELLLTDGSVALVDDLLYEVLPQTGWHLNKQGYVVRAITLDSNCRRPIKLHQLVMWSENLTGRMVDHKNHDKRDNRKENLRIVTSGQNSFNRKPYENKTSKFKGVSKKKNGWVAQISCAGKPKYLGFFIVEEKAAAAYDKAARELFGEYAYLNFNAVPAK